MMSSPSRSSKTGEVVDEFRQHDGVVAMELVVLRQSFAKHYGGEEEVLEEGGAAPEEGRGGVLGFPRGGVAATGETLDGFGRPHP